MKSSGHHPSVAIVGRPNVGKSTLFNKLTKARKAIVHDRPGVTRDRIVERMRIASSWIWLVDTGGFQGEQEQDFLGEPVKKQLSKAIAEAEAVLFVVDGKAGLVGGDHDLASLLRKQGKPVLLIVNKVDPGTKQDPTHEFSPLGFANILPVSAEHARGFHEIRDFLEERLRIPDEDSSVEVHTSVSLAGRPNVGKSSILNAILGEERANVSEVPGTTRDVVDMEIEVDGATFRILDTAGIRRRGKISDDIEGRSAVKALQSIRDADVVMQILDAREALTGQDLRVASEIVDAQKGLLIVVNKMDLIRDSQDMRARYRKALYERAPFLEFAEFVFVSAKTGMGISGLLKRARRIHETLRRDLDPDELRQIFRRIYEKYPPRGTSTYFLKLHALHRSRTKRGTFILTCNKPHRITPEYRRLWEKQLFQELKWAGVPIQIQPKKPLKRRSDEGKLQKPE